MTGATACCRRTRRRCSDGLSIFVGGCTLEAAEAVCNAEGDLELLEVIASLVNKSLLHQKERAGQPRFGMLETIREYALEQLEASGKAEAIHREYVHYFLRLAEEAEPHLNRLLQVEWFARLEEEHDNFRAALAWSRKQEEAEPGLRLAGALHWFWFMHGYLSEGRGWLEAMLTADDRRQTMEGEPSSIVHHPSSEVRANAVRGAGYLAWAQGDYPQAVALSQEALALSRTIGDERGMALARFVLGIASMMGGDLGQARTLIETALVWPRKTGDQLFVLWGLTNLGLIAERQGEYERARALLEDGLVVAQEIGDKGSIAYAWLLLAILAQSEGDAERATTLVQDSLALLQQVGDRLLMMLGLNVLAWTMSRQGQPERAPCPTDGRRRGPGRDPGCPAPACLSGRS